MTHITLACLCSFTAEVMEQAIQSAGQESELPIRPWFGGFNQLEQLVLCGSSKLWSLQPDAVWVALRVEDIEPELPFTAHRLGPQGVQKRLTALRKRAAQLVNSIRKQSKATILVSNFCYPELLSVDFFGASDPNSLKYLLARQNLVLSRQVGMVSDAWIFDYDGVVAACGALTWQDPRTYYLGRLGIAGPNMPGLGRALVRFLTGTRGAKAKCIVLDLDDTLWRGTVGEDGMAIQLGHDYPGNVYRDFQIRLRGMRDRGFLLAIASKNDETIVRHVLDHHPEMILRTKDFAPIQANWEPKPRSIEKIASALNIGLESVVFLDNDPVERAEVRAALPMIRVPDLPKDITSWPSFLHTLPALDRPKATLEDSRRADFYQADVERKRAESSGIDRQTFLASLKMEATVGLCGEETLERIYQLIQKTNQFNLTTRRYSREEIRRLGNGPGSLVAWLRLKDDYGDQGLVCVGSVKKADETTWEIDLFLMSCRVMGRQVDTAFLSYLARLAAAAGAKRLRGIFIKTPKNLPVADFYPKHGFIVEPTTNENEQTYVLDLADGVLPWPVTISHVGGSKHERSS